MKLSFKELKENTLTTGIVSLYFVAVLVLYPLYFKYGYENISTYKYFFYLYSSVGTVLLLLLTGFISFARSLKKSDIVDLFAFLYLSVCLISFFLSKFRTQVFLGSNEWYMGLLTIIAMLLSYFLTEHLWNYSSLPIYLLLLSSAAVFLLGICDRFSIYIIPLSIRDPAYISTLGNINWFMGFYSVCVPLGIYLLYSELSKEKPIKRKLIPLTAYSLLAFATGFAQGSESVFLFDAALFFGMLVLGHFKNLKMEYFLLIIFLWACGSQIIRLLNIFIPGGFNYEYAGLCLSLCQGNTLLYVGLAALFLAVSFNRMSKDEKTVSKVEKEVFKTVVFLVPLCVILWIVTGLLRTKTDLFSNINSSLFFFNENFGSGRGEAIKVAINCLKNMNFKDYLVGVGPDGMSFLAYSIEEIASELRTFWPNDILTNAHCEPLTVLVNTGILGLLTYTGFLVGIIKRAFSPGKKEIVCAISLSVFCYMVHNLISFSQVLNTPFIFILAGISGSYIKAEMNPKD